MNKKPRTAVIVTGVLTALVAIYLSGSHCCHLHSFIIELPLLILTPTLACVWVARSSTSGRAWARTGLALVVAIGVQLAYLTWLHLPLFPRALLSRRSIEAEAKINQIRERLTQPTSAGDIAIRAAPEK